MIEVRDTQRKKLFISYPRDKIDIFRYTLPILKTKFKVMIQGVIYTNQQGTFPMKCQIEDFEDNKARVVNNSELEQENIEYEQQNNKQRFFTKYIPRSIEHHVLQDININVIHKNTHHHNVGQQG